MIYDAANTLSVTLYFDAIRMWKLVSVLFAYGLVGQGINLLVDCRLFQNRVCLPFTAPVSAP